LAHLLGTTLHQKLMVTEFLEIQNGQF